jgi:K+-sensing histidine kinase KdpD
MLKVKRFLLPRYSFAVLTVAAALMLKLVFDPLIGKETPFLLFFGAVIASAWYGGMGPGLVATALAALVGSYFFLDPLYSFAGVQKNLRLDVFVLEGVLVSLLSTALLTARRRTEISEGRYRSLVENVQDYAIISMDTTGHMESWNEGAQRIFGYGEEEILGEHFSRLFTAEGSK